MCTQRSDSKKDKKGMCDVKLSRCIWNSLLSDRLNMSALTNPNNRKITILLPIRTMSTVLGFKWWPVSLAQIIPLQETAFLCFCEGGKALPHFQFFPLQLCNSAFMIDLDLLASIECQISFLTKWNQGSRMTQWAVTVYVCTRSLLDGNMFYILFTNYTLL